LPRVAPIAANIRQPAPRALASENATARLRHKKPILIKAFKKGTRIFAARNAIFTGLDQE
jgi:hypothetical protein